MSYSGLRKWLPCGCESQPLPNVTRHFDTADPNLSTTQQHHDLSDPLCSSCAWKDSSPGRSSDVSPQSMPWQYHLPSPVTAESEMLDGDTYLRMGDTSGRTKIRWGICNITSSKGSLLTVFVRPTVAEYK